MSHSSIFHRFALALLTASTLDAQTRPDTAPLEPNPDFSATMVAGIHRFASRLTDQSRTTRKPEREKLKAILGVVDQRLPITSLESSQSYFLCVGEDVCPAFAPFR